MTPPTLGSALIFVTANKVRCAARAEAGLRDDHRQVGENRVRDKSAAQQCVESMYGIAVYRPLTDCPVSSQYDGLVYMRITVVALCLFLPVAAVAQQPAFEVASIKPANYQGGPLRVSARVNADGINFSNVTPRLCIQRAYGVKPHQVSGPEWINTERYTILAKAAGAVPEDQLLLMLQTLLAERFKLAIHRVKKEMPVYALVVAKNGPKLKEAAGEGASQIDSDGQETVFERVSMQQLAATVARSVDRPVTDRTGLTGAYSFRLAWTTDGPSTPNAADTGTLNASDPGDAPSIFTALQDRLGLKLKPTKAPVEVLVIDRIDRPSGN